MSAAPKRSQIVQASAQFAVRGRSPVSAAVLGGIVAVAAAGACLRWAVRPVIAACRIGVTVGRRR